MLYRPLRQKPIEQLKKEADIMITGSGHEEISLSSLLYSPKNETIGTIVYNAQEEGKILRVAALAIVLIVIVVVINFISNNISTWSERRHAKKMAKIDKNLDHT